MDKKNKEFHEIMQQYNISDKAAAALAHSIESRATVIKPKVVYICVNACHVFVKDSATDCPKCSHQRFDDNGKPLRPPKQLEVAPQLASLLKNQSCIDLVFNEKYNCMLKQFPGDYVEALINEKDMLLIAVVLFVDGFRPHEFG
ncbi:hypothetical protein A0J61_10839 [Choanephora cucurbitarum]|uniref:Uncharacterized protein n=1 Tax=Choanephora cucurbitarum TaxID=101091 RepID=A0A1C7MWD3_9FUNG|nr:hypothetical protein A0J61_10839 [Choanephora cucurbitarum]